MPYVDIAGVHDEGGRALTFFVVNRHAGETIDLDVDLHGFGAATIADCQVMTGRQPGSRQHGESAAWP